MSGGRMAFYLPVDLGGMVGYHAALRDALVPHGWTVDAVAAGAAAARRHTPALAPPGHVLLAAAEEDPRAAVTALVEWLVERKIDVLHTFGTTEVGDLARAALPRRLRCLVSVHTSTIGSIAIAAARRAHVDAWVCASPAPARLLRAAFRIDADRVFVIPYGIRARPLPEERFVPRPGPLRIVYVGRLDGDAKGADRLVPIAAGLHRTGVDFRLDVVGDGPFRDALARAVEGASLQQRVVLHGARSGDGVRQVLLGSDVFLLPSRTEGFGLALLEAMEAGCAPVATRIPGVTDVLLADGAGVLVAEGGVLVAEGGVLVAGARTAAFVTAIRDLANRPDARVAIASRARERAAGAFSLARMGEAYAAALATVMDAPDRRPPARSVAELRAPWTWRVGPGAMVPGAVKHALRAAAFRLGVTV